MSELESGLRILARIIARAYLEELAQKPVEQKLLKQTEVDTCRSKD
jgi:hypothetical protein